MLSSGKAYANPTTSEDSCLNIRDVGERINVLPFMSHYWDADNLIKLPKLEDGHTLTSVFKSVQFEQAIDPQNEYVLGEGNSNHWLQFCITNPSDKPVELVLASSPAVIAEIDFYPQTKGAASFQAGSSKPMAARDIFAPEFDFNIVLQAGQTEHYFLRVRAHNTAYLIASVWNKQSYLIAKDKREGTDGVLAGILIGLILYTMLLYFSVRQSSSLLYILWSTSTLILLASIDGRILQYLIPHSPPWGIYTTILFYPLTLILSALFAREFIQLKNYPRLDKASWLIIAAGIVYLIWAYTRGYANYFQANAIFAVVVVIYFGCICPLYGYFVKKSVLSKYLLIAQFPLIICVLDRSLFSIGITFEHYVPYTAKVGLVAEMILLAYCIGETIYKEKNDAQRLAYEQLERANELQNNYNQELKAEIHSNTAEIRSMNADLELQAKQLLELDEAKSKLFANISHEFRTPLTLIQGPLAMLIDGKNHPDQAVISSVIKHSKALQSLIDQVLTLSKFDGNSIALKTHKENISNAVKELTSPFTSLIESKGLEFEFRTTAPELEAYVDYEKLKIMLNNLMSNAIKFSDHGGVISVEVSAFQDSAAEEGEHATDEYVQISISDNGHGIPSNEIDYVFDRFFQSSSSAHAGTGTGTGIGLALVKELVELHAGEVSVTSQYRTSDDSATSGSTFTLRLPLGNAHLNVNEISDVRSGSVIDIPLEDQHQGEQSVADQYADDLAATDAKQSIKPATLKSQTDTTILIVDDNQDMRAYLRSLLEPTYQVIEAVDGLDAEDKVKQHAPKLIVTDLMMPKRDGLEFVKSLKQNGEFAKTPVIMLTAKAGLDNRLEGLMAAVDDYLAKPFDARELIARIENLLIKHAQFSAFYLNDTAPNVTANETSSSAEQEDDIFLTELRNMANQHLSDASFGVTELASLMHLSKATLHRRLSATGKFTPSEFLRHCRLEKARQLSIAGQARTLSELANAVGFNQAAYFSRLYQKAFNSKPMVQTNKR